MIDGIVGWILPYRLVMVGCSVYEGENASPDVEYLGRDERFLTRGRLLRQLERYEDLGEILDRGPSVDKTYYALRGRLPATGGEWRVEVEAPYGVMFSRSSSGKHH